MTQLTNRHAAERKPMGLAEILQALNRLPTLLFASALPFLRRFERLQDYVLGILEGAGFKPAFDERFDFGFRNLYRHFAPLQPR